MVISEGLCVESPLTGVVLTKDDKHCIRLASRDSRCIAYYTTLFLIILPFTGAI